MASSLAKGYDSGPPSSSVEKADPNRNPWLSKMHLCILWFCCILLNYPFFFRVESVNVLFSSSIRFLHMYWCSGTSDIFFFINKRFRTCAKAFPNKFSQVIWILHVSTLNSLLDARKSNSDLRSRLFTYDIMKNFNCN